MGFMRIPKATRLKAEQEAKELFKPKMDEKTAKIEDLISKIENNNTSDINLIDLESDITGTMIDLIDQRVNELVDQGHNHLDQETLDKAEKTLPEEEKAELKRRSEQIIAQKKEMLNNIKSLEKLVEDSTGKQSVVLSQAKYTLESAKENEPRLKREIKDLENFDEYLKKIKDRQKHAFIHGENGKATLSIFAGKKQRPKARITENAAMRAGKKQRPKARITENAAMRAIYVSSGDESP